jgi:hypothetical protein
VKLITYFHIVPNAKQLIVYSLLVNVRLWVIVLELLLRSAVTRLSTFVHAALTSVDCPQWQVLSTRTSQFVGHSSQYQICIGASSLAYEHIISLYFVATPQAVFCL